MKPRLYPALLALCASALAADEKIAVPFRDISFDAACTAAAAEKKIVFVDFFTTWCGPCKELDRTTWSDPAVAKLLREKSVPLKIDAEKEVALAKRYKIEAYPTLLLIKPDGTEQDRLLVSRDAATFIREFSSALAGKNPAERAAEVAAAEKAENETVQARYKSGRALAREGKSAEALKEYLWCYDIGMVRRGTYAVSRSYNIARSIAELGRNYPPALAALRKRRDEAGQRVDAGTRALSKAQEFQFAGSDFAATNDFATLNSTLNEEESTLAVFDRMAPDDPRRTLLSWHVYDLLAKSRRYNEAAKVMPFEDMLRQLERDRAEIVRMAADPSASDRVSRFTRDVLNRTAKNIEVLVGSGQLDAAVTLGAKLFEIENSSASRQLLRESASRGGHPELWAETAPKKDTISGSAK